MEANWKESSMKKLWLALFTAIVLPPTLLADTKVPVDVGEGVTTVTVPLVISDTSIVVRMVADKDDKGLKRGEVRGYAVEVYYPQEWKLSVHPEGKEVFSVTFKEENRQGEPIVSLRMDLRHPLNNLGKEEREQLVHELAKVLGTGVKDLTFIPDRGLVKWEPTKHEEIRRLAGLENLADALTTTEKVVLPGQKGTQPPFTLEKVGMLWEALPATKEKLARLAGLADVTPFLSAMKESPIRIKEGFLQKRLDPNFVGKYEAGQGWEWVLTKNKGVIRVIPALEYFVAIGDEKK